MTAHYKVRICGSNSLRLTRLFRFDSFTISLSINVTFCCTVMPRVERNKRSENTVFWLFFIKIKMFISYSIHQIGYLLTKHALSHNSYHLSPKIQIPNANSDSKRKEGWNAKYTCILSQMTKDKRFLFD